MTTIPLLHFGEFTLDRDTRALSRGGIAVPLTGKAFELLAILVEHRPKVLTKAELLSSIWPTTFVTEASLHSLVSELRGTLGDTREAPLFLRTVHGYGYAFAAAVTETAGERHDVGCSILWGDREVPLADGENILGRDRKAAVRVSGSTVSRRHARILIVGDRITIEDLGSKNGTKVQGRPVEGRRELRHGDEIRLGSVRLTIRLSVGAVPTSTMVPAPR